MCSGSMVAYMMNGGRGVPPMAMLPSARRFMASRARLVDSSSPTIHQLKAQLQRLDNLRAENERRSREAERRSQEREHSDYYERLPSTPEEHALHADALAVAQCLLGPEIQAERAERQQRIRDRALVVMRANGRI
jgi:hypothetical protein